MRALSFKIPKTGTSSIRVQIDHQPYFYDILHQHLEIQLTLIVSGTGTLFQGDYIGDFRPKDVFVIGTNVPHVLKSDTNYYHNNGDLSHAVSIFFEEKSLGDSFFDLPELKRVKQLLHESIRGIKLLNSTKEIVGKQILAITRQDGIGTIASLLNILNTISQSKDRKYLSKEFTPYIIDENEGIRLNEIFQFTIKDYHRTIKLQEVATMVNMTVSAFCRYFKQRTRKTYITFLNEVRIAQACKLLLNEDLAISQICYQCGFSNLSHFNRVFKANNGESPKSYRKSRIGCV